MRDKNFLYLFLAWFVASLATLGSLFFSEVMGFAPCTLCWYQRICMYPLAIILAIGLFPVEKKVIRFSLPFVVLGLFFSFYHNLLHWGVIPESAAPCKMGIPCSTLYINWFGFITIPLLSFVAFILIFVFLLLFKFCREEGG